MKEKRTTVHLSLDIEETLRKEAAIKGVSFKHVVNKYLRLGLQMKSKKKNKFKVEARDLSPHKGISFDNISELLEQIEGSNYK